MFRSVDPTATGCERTAAADEAPDLTAGERCVLLCRPVLGGNAYTEPASVADIAKELFMSQSAVTQHLGRLADL
jgi:DNA-binding MarR family transcriptional regulator